MTSLIRRTGFPQILPPHVFDDIFRDVDDVFGNLKSSVPYNVEHVTDKDGNATGARIEVACAGYAKDDIKVEVVNDELRIVGEKVDKEEKSYIHKGISERSFRLSFKLAGTYDKNGVKGNYENGMLTVEVPVQEETVIPIKIS